MRAVIGYTITAPLTAIDGCCQQTFACARQQICVGIAACMAGPAVRAVAGVNVNRLPRDRIADGAAHAAASEWQFYAPPLFRIWYSLRQARGLARIPTALRSRQPEDASASRVH